VVNLLGRGASAAVRPLVQAIAAPGNLVADTAQSYGWLAQKGLAKLSGAEQPAPPKLQSAGFNQALDAVTFSPQTTMGRINEGVASALIGSRIPMPQFGKRAPEGFVPPPATPRDAAFMGGRQQGLVAPPASVNPSLTARAAETLGGKVATEQDAAVQNMPIFTSIAKRTVGIADDVHLSPEALDQVRRTAGAAYADVAKVGKLAASADDLPKGVGVQSYFDPVSLNRKTEVDSASLVEAWKQLNHDATAYFRAAARDANPETLAKAKQAAASAKQIDTFLDKALRETGNTDLLKRLKDARVLIAKTHSVEGALNPSTGVVSGTKLAQQLSKGKPLSGDLKTAAQFAQAFPKAAREILDSGSVRNTDLIVGGGTAAVAGQPGYLIYPFLRSAARSGVLSPAVQNRLLQPRAPISPRWFTGAAPLFAD
jgi:hypothetical protein